MEELDAMRDYIGKYQAHYGSYHNHKENMAHLAIAAQVVFTISVIQWDNWPSVSCNIQGITLLCTVLLLNFALYLYTGWEMKLRQWAALMNGAIGRCAAELAKIQKMKDYQVDSGNIGKNDKTNKTCLKEFHFIYQYIVWFPWGFECFRVKYEEKNYPEQLISEIKEAEKRSDWRLWTLNLIWFFVSISCFMVLLVTGFQKLLQDFINKIVGLIVSICF